MNFFKHKQSLREELEEAEANLLRSEYILSKIKETPDQDYLVLSALEEGTRMVYSGINCRINEIKAEIIILKIAQIIVMQDIFYQKLCKKNIYQNLSEKKDDLKLELAQAMKDMESCDEIS